MEGFVIMKDRRVVFVALQYPVVKCLYHRCCVSERQSSVSVSASCFHSHSPGHSEQSGLNMQTQRNQHWAQTETNRGLQHQRLRYCTSERFKSNVQLEMTKCNHMIFQMLCKCLFESFSVAQRWVVSAKHSSHSNVTKVLTHMIAILKSKMYF